LDTSNTISWLDNYLIWESTGDKIIVRDFDGDNRREIINNTKHADHAIITNNNNWLYYFDLVEEKQDPVVNENGETVEVAPTYNYVLKRYKLTI
jgi:hypothetical protein